MIKGNGHRISGTHKKINRIEAVLPASQARRRQSQTKHPGEKALLREAKERLHVGKL